MTTMTMITIITVMMIIMTVIAAAAAAAGDLKYWRKGHSDGYSADENSGKHRHNSPQPLPWHNCLTKDGVYPDFMCDSVCDHIENVEWGIMFVNRTYDIVRDLTSFFYRVNTLAIPPPVHCMPMGQPVMLSDVVISVGCDCSLLPFHAQYLQEITIDMQPKGHIFDTYWYWSVSVDLGQSEIVEIVLKGNVPSTCNGQATLGGWSRCATQRYLPVPDPCANPCLQGQFTPWFNVGSCSKSWYAHFFLIQKKRLCTHIHLYMYTYIYIYVHI
ncbi:hypothetical protein RFI_20853 [Reticulomyxa filosa]|uniref:Uncharacterized protein n=1 Tax=Reticulomyxa filosa TaxID=46433 RepID=X6MR65_RETFI|nr:hypothetical protein RFI_20853 [Reticulomyxa filosa]|eukprot:ETO16483.1 hypothetical protein RFI_20853 [Reticulomyxa filosa]